jgi:methylated-DNA-[protein]-cysteine S-methyltransferase
MEKPKLMNYQIMHTPIGALRLVSAGGGLHAIEFDGRHGRDDGARLHDDPILSACRQQLLEYFSGSRTTFDLPLAPVGTEFQLEVWQALRQIPYGEVRSYKDISTQIGRPKAVRAVGAANGRNPLPIVVPCHRVIGSDGSLTGFAGGLEAKTRLLDLENALPG